MLTRILTLFFCVSLYASEKNDKKTFKQLELFNKVLHLVETQYYRSVDREKLIEGALKGMMETLDPHSAFLNKEFFKKMQDDTAGEFGGLGIEVTQKDGIVYIVTPIEDTPAFREGLKPKDKIYEIDHKSVMGLTLDEVIDRMKGDRGDKIHLGIKRDGEKELLHFELVREKIKIKPIKWDILDKNYLWIRLAQFQRKSDSYIIKAIKKAKKKHNIKGILLDLRANPGGLLEQAVKISSIFLKEGIVVQTQARDSKRNEVKFVKKTGYKDLITPIAVLIDGASASASEIVAGALQDHKRAVIMGSRSFGKGSVQTVARVDDVNGIKLTIAQYMTPHKRKIQAIGIKPDIQINDAKSKWISENTYSKTYIREKDLRNHLTATIETKEEKALREQEQQLKRKMRVTKSQKSKKEKDIFKKFDPKTDYQIKQAIDYLRVLMYK